MKRKALFMVLSVKAKNSFLLLLDKLNIEQAKTKLMASILKSLPLKEQNVLIVLPEHEKSVIQSSRNLPGVGTMQAKDLNALDLLSFMYVIMPKKSIKIIEETFLKKPKAKS